MNQLGVGLIGFHGIVILFISWGEKPEQHEGAVNWYSTRTQELRIRTCLVAVAKARGIDRNCNFFPDLGTGLKISRHQTGIMLELPNSRRTVEGKVKAYNPKEPFPLVLIRGILC